MKVVMNDQTTVSKMCSVTNKLYELTVPTDKYLEYLKGKTLIQNVFPELNAEQREFLISGHTPAEWDAMFKFVEENDL
jgi:hypothetical protein